MLAPSEASPGFEDGWETTIFDVEFSSDWAEVFAAPSAHTNIVKRKIRLLLIGFQLSFIDTSGLPGHCRASEPRQPACRCCSPYAKQFVGKYIDAPTVSRVAMRLRSRGISIGPHDKRAVCGSVAEATASVLGKSERLYWDMVCGWLLLALKPVRPAARDRPTNARLRSTVVFMWFCPLLDRFIRGSTAGAWLCFREALLQDRGR